MMSRPVRRILYRPKPVVAIHLGRRLPDDSCGLPGSKGGPPAPCLTLLQVGFTEPSESPRTLVRSYRTVAPLPVRSSRSAIGGLFSVALSCGSPRLGVTQHFALWSPDVPRTGRCPYAATRPTHHRRQSLAHLRRRARRKCPTGERRHVIAEH